MHTPQAHFLRAPALALLAILLAAGACAGPDFTAASLPRSGGSGLDAGDDVDNTPLILPPDNTVAPEAVDGSDDAVIDRGEGQAAIESRDGDATIEGQGAGATSGGGTADAAIEGGRDDATIDAGTGDAAIDGGRGDTTSQAADALIDATTIDERHDAVVADARDDAPATVDAAPHDDARGCDSSHVPKDDACVVADAYGVFVSTSGLDTAAGTMSAPLKTISEGVARAAQLGKSRVYVCRGSYAEQVALDVAHDGIGLFGGLDCAHGWAWTGDKTQVSGPSALYALRIDGTTRSVAIEDMGFSVPDAIGQDGAGNGNSSIAAFVSNTAGSGVSFVRVELRAGAAADGSAGGVPPTNWYSADAGDLAGNGGSPGRFLPGGDSSAAKNCQCKSWGDTVGGAGSPAVNGVGAPGGATPPAAPDVPDGLDGHGGASFTSPGGVACMPGGAGANGSPQSGGGLPAPSTGVPGGVGWVTVLGSDGLPGDPGQGGGGGGGGLVGNQGGDEPGGGGCGGCGGAGGFGGGGGGGSIALLVSAATVGVLETRLVTSSAGQGGFGGNGESGATGGAGGQGSGPGPDWGCSGGAGGNGAGGGGGGGGAGGVSVATVSKEGSTVTVDGTTTYTLGPAGAGGHGGVGGGGADAGVFPAAAGQGGGKGIDGVSQALLSL
jgi:hypothetical protein